MRTLAAVAVLLLVSACQAPPPELTEAEIDQIETQVLEVAQAWERSWHDMDTDCENSLELMHPDHFVAFWRGSRVNREGWFEWCTASTRNRAGYDGEWTGTEVRVLSPDAAVFVGTYHSTYENVSGAVTHYPTAAQIILFERTATGWGITTFNSFNGPAEAVEQG